MVRASEGPAGAAARRSTLLHICIGGLAAWAAAAGLCQPLRADMFVPSSMPTRIVDAATGQEVAPDAVVQLSTSLPAIGGPAMRSKYPFITGAGQTVAVIDTGFDYTHPALASQYIAGYDFADNDNDPMDTHGHGTHVSGIVASQDATYGGVAPGAGIAALKVIGDGSNVAYDSDIVDALFWVIDNAAAYNITAVNISLGGDEAWTESDVNPLFLREYALEQIKDMGIFVACAAGNEGYLHGVSYPAASPHTVSVGGTWANDDYSGYIVYWDDSYEWDPGEGFLPARMADNGPRQDNIMVLSNRYDTEADGRLDLLAPGALITSTVPLALDDDGNADGFTALLGTSMASPHAAGASVLVRQALELAGLLDPDPAKQVDQILGILQDNGEMLNDWWVELMRREGLGDHRNLAQVPKGPEIYEDWYIRTGTDTSYPLIDLDAAISAIDPIPEPATFSLVTIGGLLVVLRRRKTARRPRQQLDCGPRK